MDILEKVIERGDLDEGEARQVMGEIMSGQWSDARIAGFLIALRMKGETPDELVGFATAMRARARPFWEDDEPIAVLDTCGTGGDQSQTFNISTAAAFVAAGAGAVVAKHGNRAASSRAGSADVLEALGVNIDMSSSRLRQALREVGIAFLFAQAFHSSMRFVMPARRDLNVRTVFNILGPLASPAGAGYQVIGVASESALDLMSVAIQRLGAQHAFVVRGRDGLDEVTVSAQTDVVEVSPDGRRRFTISPPDVGLTFSDRSALLGGDARENALIIVSVLEGAAGPPRDAVLLNAGLGIAAAGLAADFASGFRLAEKSIDSGAARSKLEALRAFSAS